MRLGWARPAAGVSGELTLQVAGTELRGSSVAALATAFSVPEWRVAIDMGRCSATLAAQDTVLLTHCHSDHTAGLVAWLSAHTRRYRGRPARIVVPAERRDALLEALSAWPDLDGVHRRLDLSAAVLPTRPGSVVALGGGRQATAFAVDHGIPAVGWRLGLPQGRPDIVLTGDSTVEPFAADPQLLDAASAVVDCTFVEDGRRVAGRLSGHGHLQDWLELAPGLPCDHLVLAHLPPEVDRARLTQAWAEAPRGPEVTAWYPQPAENGV